MYVLEPVGTGGTGSFALCFGQALTSVQLGQKKAEGNFTFLNPALGKLPGRENLMWC